MKYPLFVVSCAVIVAGLGLPVPVLGQMIGGSASGSAVAVGGEGRLVPRSEVASTAVVRDVHLSDGVVSGVVANTSNQTLRDVKILVHLNWLWKDERHPGHDSLGRSQFITLDRTIPPGGTTVFTYKPSQPLSTTKEGRFEASAEIVGVTEIGS
jgi:hypothetical protein